MSKQERSDERIERFDIVQQLPPSPQGTYEYKRDDGTVVHGDASGEWTLDEDGQLEDIVLFVSPGWMRRNSRTEEE